MLAYTHQICMACIYIYIYRLLLELCVLFLLTLFDFDLGPDLCPCVALFSLLRRYLHSACGMR